MSIVAGVKTYEIPVLLTMTFALASGVEKLDFLIHTKLKEHSWSTLSNKHGEEVRGHVHEEMLDPYSILGFMSFGTFVLSILYNRYKKKGRHHRAPMGGGAPSRPSPRPPGTPRPPAGANPPANASPPAGASPPAMASPPAGASPPAMASPAAPAASPPSSASPPSGSPMTLFQSPINFEDMDDNQENMMYILNMASKILSNAAHWEDDIGSSNVNSFDNFDDYEIEKSSNAQKRNIRSNQR